MVRFNMTFTGMRGRAMALAGAICMASLIAACGASRGTGDIVGAAARQAQEGPAQVTVSPSDQAQCIALNSPVQVSVKNGHLESVTLTDDVGGDPGTGNMSPTQDAWTYTQGLDSHARYTVDVTAVGSNGKTTTTTTTFSTLLADKKLVTTVTPGDGETVGVGDTINLKFNASIPDDRKAALLQRVTVQS